MGKQLAITENSKHIIGKKLFITDNNRMYKKGKKAFLTVGGVHRLVYSSGTIWQKYNCEIQYDVDTYYERSDKSDMLVGTTDTRKLHYSDNLYGDYSFTKSLGFRSSGMGFHFNSIDSIGSAPIGAYIINSDDTEVYKIISVDGFEGDYYFVTYEVVDACEEITTSEITGYTQGSTSYGTIEVEEGVLPESGTLIEGSVADGYCVLEIDGTYYYYVIN